MWLWPPYRLSRAILGFDPMSADLFDEMMREPWRVRLLSWPFDPEAWTFVGTATVPSESPDVDDAGKVRWEAVVDGGVIQMEWDWVHLRCGPIVMKNAMQVETNALLLNEAGLPVADSERLFCLTRTIYGLSWEKLCKIARPDASH